MLPELTVKKTLETDFEKIYPLLQKFDSPYSQADWKKIFCYQWDGAENHVGYHIESNDMVVGFIGLIFSCRYKNNIRYSFCNISSLIVEPKFRSATLLLLRKLSQYKNMIFTGLGPIHESYHLMIKLGFVPFEESYQIIPTINALLTKKNVMQIYDNEILSNLGPECRRIYNDHKNLKCDSILIKCRGDNLLLIYNVSQQKHCGINVKKIHLIYANDVAVLQRDIHQILKQFATIYGYFSALYVDKRYLKNRQKLFMIERKINPPKIRSQIYIDKIDVDGLYSEAVLL